MVPQRPASPQLDRVRLLTSRVPRSSLPSAPPTPQAARRAARGLPHYDATPSRPRKPGRCYVPATARTLSSLRGMARKEGRSREKRGGTGAESRARRCAQPAVCAAAQLRASWSALPATEEKYLGQICQRWSNFHRGNSETANTTPMAQREIRRRHRVDRATTAWLQLAINDRHRWEFSR